jgi:hypothetical protein
VCDNDDVAHRVRRAGEHACAAEARGPPRSLPRVEQSPPAAPDERCGSAGQSASIALFGAFLARIRESDDALGKRTRARHRRLELRRTPGAAARGHRDIARTRHIVRGHMHQNVHNDAQ